MTKVKTGTRSKTAEVKLSAGRPGQMRNLRMSRNSTIQDVVDAAGLKRGIVEGSHHIAVWSKGQSQRPQLIYSYDDLTGPIREGLTVCSFARIQGNGLIGFGRALYGR